ncbi:MAG: ketoacyl-ACP synthase III [Bacteroidetes bacterium]|nr:ketoacyl-ACP synthase III [Bacteroidota bacterium]
MWRLILKSTGAYLPKREVFNKDLEPLMDTTDAWIQERSGIQSRRFADLSHETCSFMGASAAQDAMDRANWSISDPDLLIFSTLSPDYYFPGSGVLVQRELDLPNIPCLDIRAQCSGFIYGLSVAQAYIESGKAQKILLVCSEAQSALMELSTRGRNISVLFGDAAAAVCLEAKPISDSKDRVGLIDCLIHSDGRFAEELVQKNPGTQQSPIASVDMMKRGEMLPYMNGPAVFKHATARFREALTELISRTSISSDEWDWFIPHQANQRISQHVASELSIPQSKLITNIHCRGNTTSASIPLALHESISSGRIQKGEMIAMAAFGSGFTWGAALLQY